MRRFYSEARAAAAPDGFHVQLDGKPIRTPAQARLVLPNERLAAAIAEEWQRQEERVVPHDMPLMRLAATAIDRVEPMCERVIDEIAGFAGTDLLCYRSDHPAELVERQEKLWQPMLDWLHRRYDVHLQVTRSILPMPQSEAVLRSLRAVVSACDPLTLSALHALTTGFGSLVLALAVLEEEITAAEAVSLSELDEIFQAERWGVDREAMERRQALRHDLLMAARFLDLVRGR